MAEQVALAVVAAAVVVQVGSFVLRTATNQGAVGFYRLGHTDPVDYHDHHDNPRLKIRDEHVVPHARLSDGHHPI